MTHLSLLELPVVEGDEDEFVLRFSELRIFETAGRPGGMLSARLLRPEAPGRPFYVIAEWDAPESYQAWLADPERARVNAPLAALLAGETRGGLYSPALDYQKKT